MHSFRMNGEKVEYEWIPTGDFVAPGTEMLPFGVAIDSWGGRAGEVSTCFAKIQKSEWENVREAYLRSCE